MAKTAPHQPEQDQRPPKRVYNRTLVLTAAGYRATDPPPGRRPATVSVIQEFSREYGRVNDLLVEAIGILTGIGYTVGDAAAELLERIDVAASVAYGREREEARA